MPAIKKLILFLGDIAALYVSLALALVIRYGTGTFFEYLIIHLAPFSLIFLVWVLVLYLADLYRSSTLRSAWTILTALTPAVIIAGTLSVVLFYLFGGFFELTPKTNLLVFALVFLVIDACWRIVTRTQFRSGTASVVVVGDSPLTTSAAAYINENPHAGYRVVAWFKTLPADLYEQLSALASRHDLQALVLQPDIMKNYATLKTIYRLLPFEIGIVNFNDFYELLFEKAPLEEVDEGWFIENISTHRPFYDSTKRVTDFALSVALSLVLLPLMLVIGILVALTSRGPVIFKQRRIGKNGVPFMLYKFRVMVVNHNGSPWTTKNDPRLTPIGRVLNFTHLNELPQLMNILTGDISFTGPRPESAELAEQYKNVSYYEIRHIVKPGLTGWAQINFRPSASKEEAFEKLKYDIYYVKNRSVFLDILIIVRTIRYIFVSH